VDAPLAAYFSPFRTYEGARAKGCYTCRWFQGRFLSDMVVCEHGKAIQVIGQPLMGCCSCQREPGSDDI
jgi:hypothetical protein